MRKPSGFSLLELLAAIAILGILVLVAMPAFATYRRHASILAAANETMAMLREVRSRAIASNSNVGVKFTRRGDTWSYALYEDGDGDGVRNDDITAGRDHRLTPPQPLMPQLHLARIGLLPVTVTDPDGDPLLPTDDPVAFSRSAICSFSPLGSGTPGSIYMVDGTGQLYCVRVSGPTGRAHFLRYEGGSRGWEKR